VADLPPYLNEGIGYGSYNADMPIPLQPPQ
jgi:hypothetical protein